MHYTCNISLALSKDAVKIRKLLNIYRNEERVGPLGWLMRPYA